jgi:hypothetical protein
MKLIDRLEEHLKDYIQKTGEVPRYMLLTGKYERELFLDGSFQKNEHIHEQITIGEYTIPVIPVEYIIMAGFAKVTDSYQFVR